MTEYCVLSGPPAFGERAHADDEAFIAERFSWAAFLAGPFWCLFQQAWVAAALWIAVFAAATASFAMGWIPASAFALMFLILSTLTGIEAGEIRRSALERRGWIFTDVVEARDIDAAELRWFSRASMNQPVPVNAAARSTGFAPKIAKPHVSGLALFDGGN